MNLSATITLEEYRELSQPELAALLSSEYGGLAREQRCGVCKERLCAGACSN